MNLYLVNRKDSVTRDQYDSFVCVAPDEAAARLIHPCVLPIGDLLPNTDYAYGWPVNPADLVVICIGTADKHLCEGVILASLVAG